MYHPAVCAVVAVAGRGADVEVGTVCSRRAGDKRDGHLGWGYEVVAGFEVAPRGGRFMGIAVNVANRQLLLAARCSCGRGRKRGQSVPWVSEVSIAARIDDRGAPTSVSLVVLKRRRRQSER